MNIQRLTQKSIEAVQNAQNLTIENGNQQMEQIHLLSALIKHPEELISSVLTKSGVQTETLRALLKSAIDGLPKVSGGGVEAEEVFTLAVEYQMVRWDRNGKWNGEVCNTKLLEQFSEDLLAKAVQKKKLQELIADEIKKTSSK